MRHVTLARVFGLLVMLAAAGAAYWLLGSQEFKPLAPEVSGDLRYTNQAEVVGAALASPFADRNVFWLRTSAVRNALLANPAISDAQVTVTLPNRVAIALTERTPVFALQHGGSTFLVDANGAVLAVVDAGVPGTLGLPTIDDQRSAPPVQLAPGATMDPIDLAAILQLGAVNPALLNSRSTGLDLSITDDNGFVMSTRPASRQAIFGQYTPNLRPTDIIPRQVQCLRSLIGADEADVHTVYLAPLDQNCGTYLPDATPYAPTPAPTKPR